MDLFVQLRQLVRIVRWRQCVRIDQLLQFVQIVQLLQFVRIVQLRLLVLILLWPPEVLLQLRINTKCIETLQIFGCFHNDFP